MIMFSILPMLVIAIAAAILVRLYRRSLPTGILLEQSRPELLARLLPFARRGDYDRLHSVIGGFVGLICMYRACGAIATLVNRYASESSRPSPLAEQVMIYAICGRMLVLGAMAEYLLRRALPAWPAVLTASLAQVYCDMGCTLEALEIHA